MTNKFIMFVCFTCVFTQAIAKQNSTFTINVANNTIGKTKNWDSQNPDIDVIHNAAIHIAAQQCPDGGFGWPHNDCSTTYHNITAPILTGILHAWETTQSNGYLGIMVNGGDFDLLSQYDNGESRFSTETPFYMWNLSQITANPTYKDFVENHFFAELEAATYGPNDLSTSAWIDSVFTFRQGTWVNIIPWEFKSLALTSRRHCRQSQGDLFEQAILDGLDAMNDTSPDTVFSDLLGISGALWGLSANNTQSFPAINAPLHSINGFTNLQELSDYLISHQNNDGSWYWHSNLAKAEETDKDVQTSAYAILALIKANERLTNIDYLPAINLGQNWLVSMQNEFGGFPSSPGGSEATETESEALSALATIGVYDRIFSNNLECYDN